MSRERGHEQQYHLPPLRSKRVGPAAVVGAGTSTTRSPESAAQDGGLSPGDAGTRMPTTSRTLESFPTRVSIHVGGTHSAFDFTRGPIDASSCIRGTDSQTTCTHTWRGDEGRRNERDCGYVDKSTWNGPSWATRRRRRPSSEAQTRRLYAPEACREQSWSGRRRWRLRWTSSGGSVGTHAERTLASGGHMTRFAMSVG